MDHEVREELRDWFRENLLLEVAAADPSGPGNSVFIGLRFAGEKDCFSREYVHIPDQDV